MSESTHLLVTLGLACLGGLLTLMVALVGFVVKDALHKLDYQGDRIAKNAEKIAVLEASELAVRVDKLEMRLAGLEVLVGEIRADTRWVRQSIEKKGGHA